MSPMQPRAIREPPPDHKRHIGTGLVSVEARGRVKSSQAGSIAHVCPTSALGV